ncbi:MAG TPA: hydroxymethylglutaryl-CoA lyase [Terriglobia bacterium]|nr:hydroxymethylglutaryl-CoA lyase [Terriglobia bacterium]
MDKVKIIECPRDAWQGLEKIIPAEAKAQYLRKLIEAGFRHIDAVSFVAPKFVPQMADSEVVIQQLVEAGVLKSRPNGKGAENPPSPELLAPSPDSQVPSPEIIGIIVNEKGLERALQATAVTTFGYPYSISAHFRRQNANMSREESQALTRKLNEAARQAARKLVVYISMAFGNPFDEPWGPELVEETIVWLKSIGVETIALADTVGIAGAKEVGDLYSAVRDAAKGIELGVHLHSRPEGAAEKVLAAYEAGCRRFESALTGLGGCPFADDELVGNIPTEIVVRMLAEHGAETGIEPRALLSALDATNELRRRYAS